MLVLYRRYVYQRCLTIDVLVAMTILVLIESLSKKVTIHPPTRPSARRNIPVYFHIEKNPAKYTIVVLSE